MKRTVNDELANVWATIISEKMDDLQKQQNAAKEKMEYLHGDSLDKEMNHYRLLEAKISGLAESLALFSALEDGKFKKDYERIAKQQMDGDKDTHIPWKRDLTQMIKNLGYGQYVCTSFEEAEQNDRRKNIVIIDNADVYLTYKYKNKFGVFVCWMKDEFREDPSVYDSVGNWVVDIFSQSETQIDNALKANIFPFDFIPYEKEERAR